MKHLVLIGQGVEFVLRGLAQEAGDRGYPVTSIDMLTPNWRDKLAGLDQGSFNLVSSAHPYLDARSYREFHGRAADIMSLPEFVSRFQPVNTFYAPHDLQSPIKEDEFTALKYFDALFMPNDAYWFLGQFTRVIDTGWVKWPRDMRFEPIERDLVFVVSDAPKLVRCGPSYIQEHFAPILQMQPKVIVPIFADAESLVEFFSRDGCTVEVSNDCTLALATSKAVISNGLSSVVLEAAALQKPTLCVTDPLQEVQSQRDAFGSISQVRVTDALAGSEWLTNIVSGKHMPNFTDLQIHSADWDLIFQTISDGK